MVHSEICLYNSNKLTCSLHAEENAVSQVIQTLSPAVPREVLAFAIKQGVAPYLPAVLEMTQRIFPAANVIIHLDNDPEIELDQHIVVNVALGDMEVAEALDSRYQWHRDLFACCPTPLVCVFRLGMDLTQ